jgi:tRNA threonylcarbamoyladenosine biosynthesis protein TsaB
MRVLALDSTTRAGSVALFVDEGHGVTIVECAGDPSRTHAERLPADLLALLAGHHLTAREIDLFAVASGPGLFTGLRVGIATMQGLALVCGRPLMAISALDALAQLASRDAADGSLVGAWMNAHRRDVFSALFLVRDAPVFDPRRLAAREGPSVGDPGVTLQRWLQREGAPVSIAGDGAELYRTTIIERIPAALVRDPSPLAAALALIAAERYRRGERGSAAAVQPLYVRRPDAELAKENALAHRTAHVDRPNR